MDNRWLIAIDLDGTTTMNNDYDREDVGKGISRLHPLTIEGIKLATEAGHIVAINTGRPWKDAKEVYDRLEMSGWIINCAGAHIHNVEDDTVEEFKEGIPKWVIEEMRDDPVLSKHKIGFMVCDGHQFHAQYFEGDEIFKQRVSEMRDPAKEIDGTFDFDPMIAHLAFELPLEDVNKLADYSREKWGEWIHITDWGGLAEENYNCFEINAAKNNKGAAIEKLASMTGIPMERTMAMGDAENDIGAFKIANEAVCMINGNDYMKSLSTKITDLPNYEGGLGDFLIKYFDLK